MKKSLQIDENKAYDLYKTASPEFKQMLEDSFGREFFNRSITDRVKSYEDACSVLGIDPHTSMPDVCECPKEDQRSYVAFHKLVVVIRALNEGWRPDWTNTGQNKWFNWWYVDTESAGLASAYSSIVPSDSNAHFGSRLCFKSEALADYAAETFKSLYEDYLLFK